MTITVKHKNPTALKRHHKNMVQRTSKEVAVGFPAGKAQAYPDGTPVALVAASHVYGLGVPKRDFMRLAKDEITTNTSPIIKAALKTGSPLSLYNAAGQSAKDSIVDAIIALDDPPNSPVTIALKGSDNPLVDTGHMQQSVTYVIRNRTR